jgi:hypothetical protein
MNLYPSAHGSNFVLSVIQAPMSDPIPVRRWLRPGGRRLYRRTPGLYAGEEPIVATVKPKATVIGEALEPVLSVLDTTFARATNDEIIEVVFQAQDELANRARNVSKLASDAGDRDALNEAFAFCCIAQDLTRNGCLSRDARQNAAWHRAYDAKGRVEKALASARTRTPSSVTTREQEHVEKEAFLDVAAFTDEEIIASLAKAIRVDHYGRGTCPVSSHHVVQALAPKHKLVYPKNSQGQQMASPTALRMSQRLAKLAKAGRIVRWSRKWGGAHAWGIAGFQPTDEHVAKQYVVAYA